jgi:silicon transporter
MDPLTLFKSIYSIILLIFSLVTVLALIGYGQTNLSESVHPAFAYAVFIIAISWLTMVEGGQGSLVGLTPVNKELYKDSHPNSYKCTAVTNEGDNLDRYLLGRQFMVVLTVFCVNMSAGPKGGAELWGLPDWVKDIFFGTGVAMILITCMVGQLNSQVNASLCMLDYINNYFAIFTLWVAMGIEFSGLLHTSYLIQLLVGALAGQPIESKEPPRSAGANLFFWIRCLISLAALSFCIAVTMVALFDNKTTMWEGVPPGVAVVIFFILMCVVGMLEGMQIAFFAVAKLQPSERGTAKFAKMTCDLLFKGEGNNLPGFMIGRQLCVVSCMFFVARVTSVDTKGGENIFGVPDGLQSLFNTGLLGALMLTIIGSISWQLVASAFPIAFLSNPITYILLRWCLFLEATGICQGAWVLAAIHKKIAGFQRDEVYIGTAEERAKQDMGDEEAPVGAGHPVKLSGFSEEQNKTFKDEA